MLYLICLIVCLRTCFVRAASVYLSVSTIVTIRAPRYRVYSGIAELLDYKKISPPIWLNGIEMSLFSFVFVIQMQQQ